MAGIEFLINIQQRMNAGNAVTELQRTQQALQGAMGKYAEMDAAARKAEQALARNGQASAKAAEAMKKAADAGDVAGYRKASAAVQSLEAAQAGLVSNVLDAKSALRNQADEVTRLAEAFEKEQAAAKAAEKAEKDRKSAAKTTGKSDDEQKFDSADLAVAGRALGRLGGPLGQVGAEVGGLARGWNKLQSTIGTSGALMAATAVLVIALAAALAFATVKSVAFAVATADANRNFEITLDAMNKGLHPIGNVGDAFHKITLNTGVASDRLLEITKALQEARVPAAAMPDALNAIATQESALGDTSGTEKLIQQLQGGAKSAAQLNKEMTAAFGADARKRAISLDSSVALFKENVSGLFSDLNIEPILQAFHDLVQLFDKNTVAGKGLKILIEGLFGPFSANAKEAGVQLQLAFINAEIKIYDVAIALKEAQIWVEKTFGISKAQQFNGVLELISISVDIILVSFVAVAAVVGVAIAAVVAQIQVWESALDAITDVVDDVKNAFSGGDWSSIGKNIVDGVAKGITSGSPAVVGAVTGVVGLAIKAANAASDSHSPSRLFMKHGLTLPQGEAEGIRQGTAEVESAIDDMVGEPTARAPSGGGRGGNHIGTLNLHLHGVTETNLKQKVIEIVTDAFEALGYQIGAEPEPAS